MSPAGLLTLLSVATSSTSLYETSAPSFFDSYELDHVDYAVVIEAKPVRMKATLPPDAGKYEGNPEIEETLTIMPMMNKFGQRYLCFMPDISNLESEDARRKDQLEAVPMHEFMQSIRSALEPTITEECLIYTKDWWSYELCPGSVVKQFHMEEGRPVGVVVTLGHFNDDYEWTLSDRKAGKRKHHSQFYTNGSICDLTGHHRKTEVRYYCDPDAVMDVISEVLEPSSCDYLISVATPRLCIIRELQPPPSNKAREIKCHPVLSDREYQQYELYEAERKREFQVSLETTIQSVTDMQKEKMIAYLGEDVPEDLDLEHEDSFRVLEELMEMKMANIMVDKLSAILRDLVGNGVSDEIGVVTHFHSDKERFLKLLQDVGKLRKVKSTMPRKVKTIVSPEGEKNSDVSKTGSQRDENVHVSKDSSIHGKEGARNRSPFDVDAERRVRSDAVSEDEMMSELEHKVSELTEEQKSRALHKENQQVHNDMDDSLEEIIRESEREVGTRLDSANSAELKEYSDKVKVLLKNFEKNEAQANEAFTDAEKTQEIFDAKEDEILGLTETEREHYKHDNTRSVKKELRGEDYDDGSVLSDEPDLLLDEVVADELDPDEEVQMSDKSMSHQSDDSIKIVISEPPFLGKPVSGLDNSKVEERITKRVESLLKSKLKTSVQTGSSVEVKVVSLHVEDPEMAENLINFNQGKMSEEENLQFQGMIHNLMTGNQQGFSDIDSQRRSEKNYKFQLKNAKDDPVSKREEPGLA